MTRVPLARVEQPSASGLREPLVELPAGPSAEPAAGISEWDLQSLQSHEQRLPTGPDGIRRHASRARFPADDIRPVATTVDRVAGPRTSRR
jgi:hypothetical protein